MNLGKLQKMVSDREAWHAAARGSQRVVHDLVTEQQHEKACPPAPPDDATGRRQPSASQKEPSAEPNPDLRLPASSIVNKFPLFKPSSQ